MAISVKEWMNVLERILKDKSHTNKFLQNPQGTLEKFGIKTTAAVAQEVNRTVKDLLNAGKTVDQILNTIEIKKPYGNQEL